VGAVHSIIRVDSTCSQPSRHVRFGPFASEIRHRREMAQAANRTRVALNGPGVVFFFKTRSPSGRDGARPLLKRRFFGNGQKAAKTGARHRSVVPRDREGPRIGHPSGQDCRQQAAAPIVRGRGALCRFAASDQRGAQGEARGLARARLTCCGCCRFALAARAKRSLDSLDESRVHRGQLSARPFTDRTVALARLGVFIVLVPCGPIDGGGHDGDALGCRRQA
jgi:hypothetical protein